MARSSSLVVVPNIMMLQLGPDNVVKSRQTAGFLTVTSVGLAFALLVALALPIQFKLAGFIGVLCSMGGLLLTIRMPEVVFALFLFSGQFKGLPVFAQVSSFVDITVLLGALTIVAIVYVLVIERRKITFSVVMFGLWFAFNWLLIAGLLWTSAPGYGWSKTMQFVTLSSLVFIAPPIFLSRTAAVRRYFVTLALFGAIYSAFAVQIGMASISRFGFVALPGSNYLALGRVAGIAILIGLIYLLQRGLGWAVLGLIVNSLALVALLMAGGRGPVLALLGALPLLTLTVLLVAGRLERTTAFLSALLIVLFAGMVVFNLLPSTLAYRLSLLMPDTQQSGIAVREDANTGRPERWQSAVQAMAAHPLLGLGSGGFAAWFDPNHIQLEDGSGRVQREYPHNLFLEVGSELGLSGLVIVIALIVLPLYTLGRRLRTEVVPELWPLQITALALFLFTMINAMLSGDLNDNRYVWMAISLLMTLALSKGESV